MTRMKIRIGYIPPNWNEYINMERANKYKASKLKKDEKSIVEELVARFRFEPRLSVYQGSYPVELIVKPHYSNMRQDLDNFRYKGLLDGLVASGVLKNDNLKHIQRIVIEPVFDDAECVEIEIKELGK